MQRELANLEHDGSRSVPPESRTLLSAVLFSQQVFHLAMNQQVYIGLDTSRPL
jgi:hypothetical protein